MITKSKAFYIVLYLALLISGSLSGQNLYEGLIKFKRKMNLYKKFKSWEDIKEYIPESEKNKVDDFIMFFNDTAVLFKPAESGKYDPYSWASARHTTIQNIQKGTYRQLREFWGESIIISDSIPFRKWKITESKRSIAGFECRKALWQQNDSTRIYAWFAEEIPVSGGPESFMGLPGLILGLAMEDGSEVYFAESVTFRGPQPSEWALPKGKRKTFTRDGLIQEILRINKGEKWVKNYVKNIFIGIY